MENRRLRQLALLDLSILNFGLMWACRREDAPLRIESPRTPWARHVPFCLGSHTTVCSSQPLVACCVASGLMKYFVR